MNYQSLSPENVDCHTSTPCVQYESKGQATFCRSQRAMHMHLDRAKWNPGCTERDYRKVVLGVVIDLRS